MKNESRKLPRSGFHRYGHGSHVSGTKRRKNFTKHLNKVAFFEEWEKKAKKYLDVYD